MGDVFQQTAHVAIVDEAGDALRDVIHQTEGVTQEVHRTQDLGCLTLQLLASGTPTVQYKAPHTHGFKTELHTQLQHIVIHTYTWLNTKYYTCLLYTSPSPRDISLSRMPSSA